jgi:hypothetical protein
MNTPIIRIKLRKENVTQPEPPDQFCIHLETFERVLTGHRTVKLYGPVSDPVLEELRLPLSRAITRTVLRDRLTILRGEHDEIPIEEYRAAGKNPS